MEEEGSRRAECEEEIEGEGGRETDSLILYIIYILHYIICYIKCGPPYLYIILYDIILHYFLSAHHYIK